MKHIIRFTLGTLFVLLLFSCVNDDDVRPVTLRAVTVDSVRIGEIGAGTQGETEITTFVTRRSSCEGFYGYDYQRVGTERTVTVFNFITQDANCQEIAEFQENSFNFSPVDPGTYTFRFWSGTNAEGDNMFINKEVIIE